MSVVPQLTVRFLWLLPQLLLWVCLVWACAGQAHAVTITLSSYVQLLHCVKNGHTNQQNKKKKQQNKTTATKTPTASSKSSITSDSHTFLPPSSHLQRSLSHLGLNTLQFLYSLNVDYFRVSVLVAIHFKEKASLKKTERFTDLWT